MEVFWFVAFLLISTSYGEDSQTFVRVKRGTTFSEFSDLLDTYPLKFHWAMIKAHNNLRAQEAMESGASDMTMMKTGSSLVKIAQMVADKCEFKHSTKEEKQSIQSNFNYIGENLFASTRSSGEVQNVLNAWYKEKQHYDYQTVSCLQKPCGHYTQVVWAKSMTLGCAIKFCPKLSIPITGKTWENAYIAVCEYGPGGNVRNVQPYKKGGPCAACPDDCIDNELCRTYKEEPVSRRAMDTDNRSPGRDDKTHDLLEKLEELIEREIPVVATTPSPNGDEETEMVL